MERTGRNFHQLAEKNLVKTNKGVSFYEDKHEYKVEGQEEAVPISATGVVKTVFAEEDFDALGVVSKNLHKWRANASSKYHALVEDKTDEEATKALLDLWGSANVLGTLFHLHFEARLNGVPLPRDERIESEFSEAARYLDAEFEREGMAPFRTELCVFWVDEETGFATCAGQIDLLARKENGTYVMIDFKRTGKKLEEDANTYGKWADPEGPMAGFGVNDFRKYSFQQSLYCVMLEQCAGIVVDPEERYLLQAHPDLPTVEKVRCACYDEQAKQTLRLLGKAFGPSSQTETGKKRPVSTMS